MNPSIETLTNQPWRGTRAFITGGSSGLGLALARTLDAGGARVAVLARGRERLTRAVAGTGILAIVGDVSDKADTYRIAGEAIAHLGEVDLLVHAASSLGPTPLRLLADTDCEDLTAALETNLVGPFRLTKALLPSMVLRNRGTIVLVSSDAATSAYPEWGAYGVSKAAVDHLARVWAEELREFGVRVLAIDPGDMATPMHFDAIPDADPNELHDPADVGRDLATFLSLEADLPVRLSASEWRTWLP